MLHFCLARIRQDDPDIEVIIISTRCSAEDGSGGMRKGPFDYLMKAGDPEELVEKIDQARAVKKS